MAGIFLLPFVQKNNIHTIFEHIWIMLALSNTKKKKDTCSILRFYLKPPQKLWPPFIYGECTQIAKWLWTGNTLEFSSFPPLCELSVHCLPQLFTLLWYSINILSLRCRYEFKHPSIKMSVGSPSLLAYRAWPCIKRRYCIMGEHGGFHKPAPAVYFKLMNLFMRVYENFSGI